jgi:nitrogen regulatory protein P-II 1
MKKIQAVIRREKLQDVKQALDTLGIPGMMVWEIEGHGKQKGVTEQFRGRQFTLDFLPKTTMEIVVNDGDVKGIVDVIVKTASTGKIGDGKIFVSSIEDVVRIRTGEKGTSAVG